MGICIERSFFENLFYVCGCNNITNNYLNPGPCPGKKKQMNFEWVYLRDRQFMNNMVNNCINTDANPTTTTPVPGICLNGGREKSEIYTV